MEGEQGDNRPISTRSNQTRQWSGGQFMWSVMNGTTCDVPPIMILSSHSTNLLNCPFIMGSFFFSFLFFIKNEFRKEKEGKIKIIVSWFIHLNIIESLVRAKSCVVILFKCGPKKKTKYCLYLVYMGMGIKNNNIVFSFVIKGSSVDRGVKCNIRI